MKMQWGSSQKMKHLYQHLNIAMILILEKNSGNKTLVQSIGKFPNLSMS
jgi:hypothetical protein